MVGLGSSRIARPLRSLLDRHARFLLCSAIAIVLIVLGMWTIPARRVPANKFDEPIWMAHSLCVDALLAGRYRESCREINVEALDQSAGAKYALAIARWVAGIPPEAVKYDYHLGATPQSSFPVVDADIRIAVVTLMTALSSVSLLILFLVVRRMFGDMSALITLALLVVAPYWQYTLRSIMAEPALVFFSVLALAGTLWLAHLLTASPQPSIAAVLGVAICVGLTIGFSIGVKANAAVVAVAFLAVVCSIGIRTRTQWLLISWLSAVVILAAAVAVFACDPFVWSRSIPTMLARTRMFLNYRQVLSAGIAGDDTLAPPEALVAALSRSFHAPDYSIFPMAVSVPLCLVGIWHAFQRRHALARVGCIWLLTTGVANALLVYLDPYPLTGRGRYVLYTLLAIFIFTGDGIAAIAGVLIARRWRLPPLVPGGDRAFAIAPLRRFGTASKISAALCLACLLASMSAGVILELPLGAERALWQRYIRADTLPEQLDALNRIVEHDPEARLWYQHPQYIPAAAGEPVIEVLADYFQGYRQSADPGILRALATTGQLLAIYSPDPDTRARARYDTGQLGQALAQQSGPLPKIGPLMSEAEPKWMPSGWTESPDEVLFSPLSPTDSTIDVPQSGGYRLTAVGLNAGISPVIIGVAIDDVSAGTFVYDRGDGSWTPVSVVVNLSSGTHNLRLQLLNWEMNKVDGEHRYGAIREIFATPTADSRICRDVRVAPGVSIAAGVCATGNPAVILDARQSSATVTVVPPVPGLYDLDLAGTIADTRARRIAVVVDGRPLGGPVTFGDLPDGHPTRYNSVRFPPIYLAEGPHAVVISRGDADTGGDDQVLTLEKVILSPRYAVPGLLTPAKFGSNDPGAATIPPDNAITASWKWYGQNYRFFDVAVIGSATGSSDASVQVTVDDQMIGVASLRRDGTLSSPLPVELANGATHRITLRPFDLATDTKVMVYAVEIKPYDGPTIFPATGMHWAKEQNGAVRSDGSIVHLPANVPLARSFKVQQAGTFTVTVRVRLTDPGGSGSLRCELGFITAEGRLQETPDWIEESFQARLPVGPQELRLIWQAPAPLDIMAFTVQENFG